MLAAVQGTVKCPKKVLDRTAPRRIQFVLEMRTIYKSSFGGGFGINRNTGGARSLSTAEPPLGNVRVSPGTGNPGGKYSKPSGQKHTAGAKIYSNKAPHRKK